MAEIEPTGEEPTESSSEAAPANPPPANPPPKTTAWDFLVMCVVQLFQVIMLIVSLLTAYYGIPKFMELQKRGTDKMMSMREEWEAVNALKLKGWGATGIVEIRDKYEWDEIVIHNHNWITAGHVNNDTTFWMTILTNSSDPNCQKFDPLWKTFAQQTVASGLNRYAMVDCGSRHRLCEHIWKKDQGLKQNHFPHVAFWAQPTNLHKDYLKQMGHNVHSMRFDDDPAVIEIKKQYKNQITVDPKTGDLVVPYKPRRTLVSQHAVNSGTSFGQLWWTLLQEDLMILRRNTRKPYHDELYSPQEFSSQLLQNLLYTTSAHLAPSIIGKGPEDPTGYLVDVKKAMYFFQKEKMYKWYEETEEEEFGEKGELVLVPGQLDTLHAICSMMEAGPVKDIAKRMGKLRMRTNVESFSMKQYKKMIRQWRAQQGFGELEEAKGWCDDGSLGLVGSECIITVWAYHLYSTNYINGTVPNWNVNKLVTQISESDIATENLKQLRNLMIEENKMHRIPNPEEATKTIKVTEETYYSNVDVPPVYSNLINLWSSHNQLIEHQNKKRAEHQKVQMWPSKEQCPTCYTGEERRPTTFVSNTKNWNKNAVYGYLMQTFCYGIKTMECMPYDLSQLKLMEKEEIKNKEDLKKFIIQHSRALLVKHGFFGRYKWRRYSGAFLVLLLVHRWCPNPLALFGSKKKKVD
mmetsp:Transcript_33825/g.40888  ORF Transcript_33825/g.40888 Transcript_33825/m.40888 type:complete len:689 (+) Transcript_33825:172-2238(+)|eukprot:CAMPEP_0197867860 /NCGR_PEP_ID=MMETSP1438-20131217/44979_1 /TAXON_ID=1461541 /ORGANISM="Pterosperma sp., Strain CCMP1384" /LENGTH=688 /DNA_ID=CAMNT_0043486533 /DNA_START=172 /DNA_END=2238 /DNA_ORIENTATION=+